MKCSVLLKNIQFPIDYMFYIYYKHKFGFVKLSLMTGLIKNK
jgi:hypothetical protein